MPSFSTVHGGHYDSKYFQVSCYVTFEYSSYCMRHSSLTQFGAFSLDQPVRVPLSILLTQQWQSTVQLFQQYDDEFMGRYHLQLQLQAGRWYLQPTINQYSNSSRSCNNCHKNEFYTPSFYRVSVTVAHNFTPQLALSSPAEEPTQKKAAISVSPYRRTPCVVYMIGT